jgi:hypothetical protein
VDYVHNKQNKIIENEHSTDDKNVKLNQGNVLDQIIDDNNRWRGPCEIDRREPLVKTIDKYEQRPYYSYKVNISNTIV